MQAEVTEICNKVHTWVTGMHKSYASRHIMWHGLKTTIWRSIDYKLKSSTMSKKQGDCIATTLYRSILPRLGAARTLPNVYRYAPLEYQGLDLRHPHTEQAIHQLHRIMVHGTASTTTGHLFRTSLEHMQLEVGIGTLVLESDFKTWGNLATHSLVKTAWEFLPTAGVTLRCGMTTPTGQIHR